MIRQYPLIPGIDLVGTVAASDSDEWHVGDGVILNGWGVGETHHGGLAERARVGDWLVPLPAGLAPRQAAAIGTAGFTAMLAVLALERSGALYGSFAQAYSGTNTDVEALRAPRRMCWSPARPGGSVRSPSRSCRPSAIG